MASQEKKELNLEEMSGVAGGAALGVDSPENCPPLSLKRETDPKTGGKPSLRPEPPGPIVQDRPVQDSTSVIAQLKTRYNQ